VKHGVLDLSDLKHVPLAPPALRSMRLQAGDILMIRTSGSRDLVGTCAVFAARAECVFASYLVRLRLHTGSALPEFVEAFVNGPWGRRQVDAVSRPIMQSNINSEEIESLRIPLPPLDVQRALVAGLRQARQAILREEREAREVRGRAEREVEEMIVGTRPVPAPE
jgi:type I restriction enzyme S subunit